MTPGALKAIITGVKSDAHSVVGMGVCNYLYRKAKVNTMANSRVALKPSKPYTEFPLYAHNSKRWAKKIRQRTHFFGPWDNWQAALERFQYEIDYLQQGKTPPPRNQTALTVGELVNSMLAHKEAKVQTGEKAQRTWDDYKLTGDTIIASLGS